MLEFADGAVFYKAVGRHSETCHTRSVAMISKIFQYGRTKSAVLHSVFYSNDM